MSLPQFQSNDKDFQLMQNSWGAALNPLLSNPVNQVSILSQVALINGTTVVNHLLGKKLQGWFIVGQNAAAKIYDQQASNQTPNKTLILVSDAAVTVNLGVF